jgi:hypothetical protein
MSLTYLHILAIAGASRIKTRSWSSNARRVSFIKKNYLIARRLQNKDKELEQQRQELHLLQKDRLLEQKAAKADLDEALLQVFHVVARCIARGFTRGVAELLLEVLLEVLPEV